MLKENEIVHILADRQYITSEDQKAALNQDEQGRTTVLSPLEYLKQQELVTDSIIGEAIAEYYEVPFFSLSANPPSRGDVTKIPEQVGREYRIVLFDESDELIKVATDNTDVFQDPQPTVQIKRREEKEQSGGFLGIGGGSSSTEAVEELSLETYLESMFQAEVQFGFTLSDTISDALQRYKPELSDRFQQIIEEFESAAPEIVDQVIAEAVDGNISDIHFEPLNEEEVRVRFRLDGVLQHVGILPTEYYENMRNLIKVQANLRTDEHFRPQDGAIRYEDEDISSDVRVSIMPAVNGEKIVLRILSNTMKKVELEELGVNERQRELVYKSAQKPFGMILISGPTGSGKSTTLYAALKTVNDLSKNITTIEDPVEYKIPGVNHIQVNRETDLTFARGLRSILRQDPDIILVGEIRDNDTAHISVNAALTGHLLFSTIHANDAESTIPRLLNNDVDPFLVSSTLELVIAQRLVRTICPNCKGAYTLSYSELTEELGYPSSQFEGEEITLYKGKGCPSCEGSGYQGRIGVFEMIEITQSMRELIMEAPTATEIGQQARSEGFITMFEHGIEKVKIGETTIEEVQRVAPSPEEKGYYE